MEPEAKGVVIMLFELAALALAMLCVGIEHLCVEFICRILTVLQP